MPWEYLAALEYLAVIEEYLIALGCWVILEECLAVLEYLAALEYLVIFEEEYLAVLMSLSVLKNPAVFAESLAVLGCLVQNDLDY